MTTHRELECKIAIPAREPVIERLLVLGARDLGDRYERNQVYDRGGELRAGRRLLRVRDDGGRTVITYKGAPQPGQYKTREELEIVADSFETACLIFSRLGYENAWYYEKRRHEFEYRSCMIAVDLLPVLGCFVEVEGSNDAGVTAVLGDLALKPEQHLPQSYLALYMEECQRNGMPLGDLRFASLSGT